MTEVSVGRRPRAAKRGTCAICGADRPVAELIRSRPTDRRFCTDRKACQARITTSREAGMPRTTPVPDFVKEAEETVAASVVDPTTARLAAGVVVVTYMAGQRGRDVGETMLFVSLDELAEMPAPVRSHAEHRNLDVELEPHALVPAWVLATYALGRIVPARDRSDDF